MQNDTFDMEEVNSPEWRNRLQRYKDKIEQTVPSVGRIEITGHHDFEWVGTGFLVAPRIVLTNRHVAQIFCESDTEFREGMKARIDFREEYKIAGEEEIKIIKPLAIGEKYDFALFEVESSHLLPKPLLWLKKMYDVLQKKD
ncbi:MAG: hypothetical protein ACFFC7_25820 [Candidatus Hermodarchaeota archaeon]